LQISPEAKLQIFDDILSFHAHVAKQNYVAIDFYDGCIMYDFDNSRAAICDVELYEKAPAKNNMGRMYGSSRFMSPEEFQLGATIDEITNVYTMGATAFALFSDERDRSYEKWTLSRGLFDVAKKAVSDERSDRQQSIEQFISEWRAKKC
jgi:serine/threonine-protein kinase